jgi:hypothetical protein
MFISPKRELSPTPHVQFSFVHSAGLAAEFYAVFADIGKVCDICKATFAFTEETHS